MREVIIIGRGIIILHDMLSQMHRRLIILCGVMMLCAAALPTDRVARLWAIYNDATDTAYSRHAVAERDGTIFISSGDIDMEWLRDSSAVMLAYMRQARDTATTRATVRGVVARQARYILIDPYANAFTEDYKVGERKFEVDSPLYPIRLAFRYWRTYRDTSIFTPTLQRAFTHILQTLRTEQRHGQRSTYRDASLLGSNDGMPFRYTGMIWTGFRPSDDPAQFPFNIPQNMFAVVELQQLTAIEKQVYRNERLAEDAWGLSVEVQNAIEHYGIVNLPGFGRIYAYEVDGIGHANLMDDANIPSLLSAPYIGYVGVRDPVYQATRRFVLSPRDPYYFSGRFASGVGSAHTPRNYVWPLSLIVEALTSTDASETQRVLGYLAASDTGNHELHESFDVNDPRRFTRKDFAWPNALFTELARGSEWPAQPASQGK
jgi:meiotically up-regulated gene 157 (Mug157) protein